MPKVGKSGRPKKKSVLRRKTEGQIARERQLHRGGLVTIKRPDGHVEVRSPSDFPRARKRSPQSPFQVKLEKLGHDSYESYLNSKHWRRFKEKYRLSGRKMVCFVCGSPGVEFHHNIYDRLGRERFSDVDLLCRSHHEEAHDYCRSQGNSREALRGAAKVIRRRFLKNQQS